MRSIGALAGILLCAYAAAQPAAPSYRETAPPALENLADPQPAAPLSTEVSEDTGQSAADEAAQLSSEANALNSKKQNLL
jgi:hypothetical protein